MPKIVEKYSPSLILCAFSKKTIIGNQVQKTKNLLQESLNISKSANIPQSQIVLDPSIGFFRNKGKKSAIFTKINSDWIQRDLPDGCTSGYVDKDCGSRVAGREQWLHAPRT